MKNKKGVTLISLMIYLIALSILIGISSTFIGFFYQNSSELTDSSDSTRKYTRLIQYITDDINSGLVEEIFITDEEGNDNVNIGNKITIRLKEGIIHQYEFDNTDNSIYYISSYDNGEDMIKKSQVKLCDDLILTDNGIRKSYFEKNPDVDKGFEMNIMINNINYKNAFIAS